jgi:imidazoleglycerol phosphate synthase cyclase subunit
VLTTRIIPCLDVRHGRVVKGVRFGGLRDIGAPAELAARYDNEGADEIVVLDVSATPENAGTHLDTVRAVRRALPLPVTVGGGIRGLENARALLEAGADKVALNTAAVNDPELIDELAARFGRQCVVISIDAARNGRGYEVCTVSGRRRTGKNAVDWAREAVRRGAGEILLTSYDRDGTQSGYDLDLISQVARATDVPVIASGGAAKPEDLWKAIRAGAHAVLAATIFHDRFYTIGEIKSYLSKKGATVRS